MRKKMFMVVLGALVLLYGGVAQATITGQLWQVPEAIADNAILANLPGTPADVTFDVNSPIYFSSGYAGFPVPGAQTAPTYVVENWLANGGAFNISGSASVLGSPLDGTPVGGTQFGTLVYFTGQVSVTNGETFTVSHDDGLTLVIGGFNLAFNPGPTAPVISTETYTGPTGTFPFQLLYGECCGAPAVLAISLPLTNVPEPTTLLLLGLGLVGLASVRGSKK